MKNEVLQPEHTGLHKNKIVGLSVSIIGLTFLLLEEINKKYKEYLKRW